MTGPRITILTPVFNEEANLDDYASEVRRVLYSRDDIDFRVLFIDDGSTDSSWAIVERLAREDPRFRGIRLSRNFGSHTALSAGFAEADPSSAAVATLACDLQDPPETVLEFVQRWREGVQIVWGERRTRDDKGWKIWASRAFNNALRRYAMPAGSQFTTGSFLLVDRQVVDCINQFREHNRITFALVAWTGFDQTRVPYDRRARAKGASGWNFAKMTKAMYDAFIGLSTLPIRLMKMAAAAAFLIATLLVIYLIVVAVVGTNVPGWTSQMLTLSAFFGVQFSMMAIMGEYLSRIYAEAIQRPLYFVSRRTDASPPGAEEDATTSGSAVAVNAGTSEGPLSVASADPAATGARDDAS